MNTIKKFTYGIIDMIFLFFLGVLVFLLGIGRVATTLFNALFGKW